MVEVKDAPLRAALEDMLSRHIAAEEARGVWCHRNYVRDLETIEAQGGNGTSEDWAPIFRGHTHTPECWCSAQPSNRNRS